MSRPAIRTALVTGGATGIGAAISTRLAAQGLNVFAVQRTETAARDGQKLLGDYPTAGRIHVAAHDISTGQGCVNAVSDCIAHFGSLEVLVNNAGVTGAAAIGALANCEDEQIDRVIDTNLKAPLRLAREALPHLAVSGGVIVNISSTAELQAQPEAPAYVASKAGLGGLTRALGYDLAALGVRVVCIAPGDVETATSRSPTLRDKRARISWEKRPPLGYSAQPSDVANAVAWVISDQARYVTGSTLLVDGGITAY